MGFQEGSKELFIGFKSYYPHENKDIPRKLLNDINLSLSVFRHQFSRLA